MNYAGVLRDLIAEREKLKNVIAALEDLQATAPKAVPGQPKRRGRKSMGEAERLEVSARMKRYWAKRRRQKGATA